RSTTGGPRSRSTAQTGSRPCRRPGPACAPMCDGSSGCSVVGVVSGSVNPSEEHSRLATPGVRRGVLDAAEFDALFRQCGADVHAYVLSLLGDRSAAEDVTALAFERLYRSRSRLDRRRGTPRAWLFSIART